MNQWKIERDEGGSVLTVLREDSLRGMGTPAVVRDPLWTEVARLAAEEERARIVDYLLNVAVDTAAIKRGDHWKGGQVDAGQKEG